VQNVVAALTLHNARPFEMKWSRTDGSGK